MQTNSRILYFNKRHKGALKKKVMHCGSAKALSLQSTANLLHMQRLRLNWKKKKKHVCPTLPKSFFLLQFNNSLFLYQIHFSDVSYLYAFPDTSAAIEIPLWTHNRTSWRGTEIARLISQGCSMIKDVFLGWKEGMGNSCVPLLF